MDSQRGWSMNPRKLRCSISQRICSWSPRQDQWQMRVVPRSFMHLSALGDERYLDWKARLEQFDRLVERDWPNVVRWWSYYTSDQWNLFDSHALEYWSDDWPDDPSDLARHDAIHRALEVIFLHVCGSTYVELNLLARQRFPGPTPEKVDPKSASRSTCWLGPIVRQSLSSRLSASGVNWRQPCPRRLLRTSSCGRGTPGHGYVDLCHPGHQPG